MKNDISDKIMSADILTEEDKQTCLRELEKVKDSQYINPMNEFSLYVRLNFPLSDPDREFCGRATFSEWHASLRVDDYFVAVRNLKSHYFKGYLDSEPIYFDGDIIITDPCYVMREDNRDDWDESDCGQKMEKLGVQTYMTRDTIYGDWSCTTFNSDTKEPIGKFCADAGLVSVFLLDEILKYNPEFNYHRERPWTTTLIENFKGTVQFTVTRESGVYKEDSKYYKKGQKWEDYSVHVVGRGINKITGEPINFITSQTGL